jgi:hypothetical protein
MQVKLCATLSAIKSELILIEIVEYLQKWYGMWVSLFKDMSKRQLTEHHIHPDNFIS